MKFSILRPAAIALLLVTSLAACGGTAGSTGSQGAAGLSGGTGGGAGGDAGQCGKTDRTITHALGTTTVKGDPSHVVVTEFSFADGASLLGVRPVGVADDSDRNRIIEPIRERLGDYTSVGLRKSPSLPVIASLRPDLIVIDAKRNADIYPQLSAMAPTIALTSQEGDLAANIAAMRALGQALNRCAEMEKAVTGLQDKLASIRTRIDGLPAKPKALFAVAADKTFTAHNGAAFVPSVLSAIGLEPALPADQAQPQADMGLETLVATAPEAMFIANYTPQNPITAWRANKLFAGIPAVASNRLFSVDPDVWARNRGVTAAEMVAEQAADFLLSAK
ncbi:ABC transporter substrate-binding protein [Microtetraspora fusca]|uniref:ABC transporter substrate-binding protein n=1 Tax=Microtetraspora fusca TaxID=1997 RepID=A0ABW6VH89_MICFU|nr:ABC transporter substrate-binding protein [Microtetraspora fusca]